MNGSELFKSTRASLGAATVLWGLYFLAAIVHTIVSGRRASELLVAAWLFAIYGVVFAVALLLFFGPLLQFSLLRRLGAAMSLPISALLSVATVVAISLYFRDSGDPSTVRTVLAYWGREPLSFFVAFSPFLAASVAFAWFRGRAGRS